MSNQVDVYDFTWVTPDSFDPDNLSISTEAIHNTERYKLMYKYDDGESPKELYLTLPLDQEAFVIVSPLKKSTFKNAGKTLHTNNYRTSFYLNVGNNHHTKFYETLEKISISTGKKPAILPIVPYATGVRLYANLIQSSEGKIYTPFYTKDEVVDILSFGSFEGRPALSFSFNKKTNKISAQIYQAYIHKQVKNFPLAIRD